MTRHSSRPETFERCARGLEAVVDTPLRIRSPICGDRDYLLRNPARPTPMITGL